MIGLGFLIGVWFATYGITRRWFSPLAATGWGLTIGTLVAAWVLFGALYLAPGLFEEIALDLILVCAVTGIWQLRYRRPTEAPSRILVIGAFAVALAGIWLFFRSISHQDDQLLIGSWSQSDFAAHLPLIRSFSVGSNVPLEYPLFSGEPNRYHFLFDLLVGGLEKLGLSLDWAMNLPSIGALVGIWLLLSALGKQLFGQKGIAIGILAFVFFFLNGSFEFVEFFRQHSVFAANSWKALWNLGEFYSFAPYKPGLVTAFWSQNILTNQRHLVLGLGSMLALIVGSIEFRHSRWGLTVLGILMGGLFLVHAEIFLGLLLFFGLWWLLERRELVYLLFPAALVALPQYILLNSGANVAAIAWQPGYLAPSTGIWDELRFWTANLGLAILSPLAFIIPWVRKRWRFFVALYPLFLIPNLVRLSPEIAGEHKFLNQWLLVWDMLTAAGIVFIFSQGKIGKVIACLAIIVLTFSGLIDLMVFKNDRYLVVGAETAYVTDWVERNTPPDARFLTSIDTYHPVELAGRRVYLGWPYFGWSLGYDTTARQDNLVALEAADPPTACALLGQNKLDYVVQQEGATPFLQSAPFLQGRKPLQTFEAGAMTYRIFETVQLCHGVS